MIEVIGNKLKRLISQTRQQKTQLESTTDVVSEVQNSLHHIFLWMFSLVFLVNITILTEYFSKETSKRNHSSYVSLDFSLPYLVVLGVLYWFSYLMFVRNFRHDPSLKFRSGWTITTLILSSLAGLGFAAMALTGLLAGITFDLVIKCFAAILYFCLVTLIYMQINFANPGSKLRQCLIEAWSVVLAVLILAMSAAGVWLVNLNKKDAVQVQEELAKTASQVIQDYRHTKQLPANIEHIAHNSKITYTRREIKKDERGPFGMLSKITAEFEVCGVFSAKPQSARSGVAYSIYQKNRIDINQTINANQIIVNKYGKNCYSFVIEFDDPAAESLRKSIQYDENGTPIFKLKIDLPTKK